MKIDIKCGPSYAVAYMHLARGERIHVERDAMAWHSEGLQVSGGTGGSGLGRAIKRKALGGENVVFGTYTGSVEGAWVCVAPKFPGDVCDVDLSTTGPLLTQTGSLLAHTDDVNVDVSITGLRSVLLKEGVSMLRLDGTGHALLSTYGAVQSIALGPDESVIVDTGHLVAFSETIDMKVGLHGGAKNAALTGEGLVATVTGPGRVVMQTRTEQSFRSWLFPERAQNNG